MNTSLAVILGSLITVAGAHVIAGEGSARVGETTLAQNTGAADRTLGNGSMGLGDGVERLPEQEPGVKARDEDGQPDQRYDESGHGDNDTDMEHRPRRTLGDRKDD